MREWALWQEWRDSNPQPPVLEFGPHHVAEYGCVLFSEKSERVSEAAPLSSTASLCPDWS
jgi:hypothetical protein